MLCEMGGKSCPIRNSVMNNGGKSCLYRLLIDISPMLKLSPMVFFLLSRLTALHSAVVLENEKIVRMLLKCGASTNDAMVSNGRTPLISAIHKKNTVIAELLIQHGAKIDAKDKDGLTALHMAVMVIDMKNIRMLLRNGASLNIKNRYGMTPFEWILCNDNPDLDSLKILSYHKN